MTRNTSPKTNTGKLTHNVKLGYRMNYANAGTKRTPLWASLLFIVALCTIALTTDTSFLFTPLADEGSEMIVDINSVPVMSSMSLEQVDQDESVHVSQITLEVRYFTLLSAIYAGVFIVYQFSGANPLQDSLSGSLFSRKHVITVGRLREEYHEVPVRYNTNVKVRSLTKGLKCQRKYSFFGPVVQHEQIFYDVPEFPNGL